MAILPSELSTSISEQESRVLMWLIEHDLLEGNTNYPGPFGNIQPLCKVDDSMTPEGKVKSHLKKMLREEGVYFFMPVQAGYGAPGLDFYCCVKGHFLAIETKAPNKHLTDRQLDTSKKIQEAGGHVIVVSNDREITTLQTWIHLLKC